MEKDRMYKSEDKMVSHPDHYQSEGGLEVIDVIEAFTADLKGIEATDTGNAIKYICRWKNKNGIQDLEKAIWYLQHLINYLKRRETNVERAQNVIENMIANNNDCICVTVGNVSGSTKLLKKMSDLIKKYGIVRLCDLYDLVGTSHLHHSSINSQFGWLESDLENVKTEVFSTNGQCKMFFPEPHPIEVINNDLPTK